MKKVKRVTPAAKASKSKAPKKSPVKKVAPKAAPKAASKAAKKPLPKKAAPKKATPVKAKAKAKSVPVKKPAAKKSAGKSAKKEVVKAKPAAKQLKPAKGAKAAAAPSKPEKKLSVAQASQASKTIAPKPLATKQAGKQPVKQAAPGQEPKRRGRPAKVVAGDGKAPVKGEEGFMGEPDAEALAAVAAETEVKKPAKQPRRRRVRQPPRVPVTLRSRPAWAEAWTALAEAGFDAQTIPAVLRDASLMFIGLGELTPPNVESLFHFWEMAEVPAGIESTLEEAFLSQPQQADRKSSLEVLFKQALHDGTIQDTLILLGVARHFAEWRDATKRLKVLQSPYAGNPELYNLAREVVG